MLPLVQSKKLGLGKFFSIGAQHQRTATTTTVPATNSKKDRFWLQTRSQNLIPKMMPFLASPNETIEAACFPEIEIENGFPSKENTNGPKQKRNTAPKKDLPMSVPQQLFYRCSHNWGVCLARSSILQQAKHIKDHTRVFSGHVGTIPLHRLEVWKAACVNSWIHRHG